MNPRELAGIKKDLAAVTLTLRGDFDKEIKALEAATVEWDKRNNLTKEKKALDEQIAAYKTNIDLLAKEVADHETRLNTFSDALDARDTKLKAAESLVKQKEYDLANRSAVLEASIAAQKANASAVNADFQAKMEQAQEQLDSLAKREALVAAREAKVKEAMKQVGALVG